MIKLSSQRNTPPVVRILLQEGHAKDKRPFILLLRSAFRAFPPGDVRALCYGFRPMEKILVGLESKMNTLWPAIYALSLAKRMDVRIYILLVDDPGAPAVPPDFTSDDGSGLKDQLEALILNGRSEGIVIDYYIAGGPFANELIKFIQEKKISLLILGFPVEEKKRLHRNIPELLKEIRLRTNCRIEVVHQKNSKPEK